jgi:glycosyltransferase involved in cell wall biosynthesis
MRIAYLLKTFPKLSETFILNEILGLEQLGIELEIFSLRRPDEGQVHPAVSKVKGGVTYLSSMMPKPVRLAWTWLQHLALCLADPAAYWKAARFYIREQKATRVKEFMVAGVLAGKLRRRGITHLHAHFANVPTSVAEIVRVLCGVRYSFTAHAKDIYLTPGGDLRRKIRGAEFVLTCTGFNREYLRKISDTSTPIQLVYHGVDMRLFQPVEPPAEEPGTVPTIVSVGRFCEKKGFPYLIRACSMLKREGRRFRCRIVGFGEMRDKLAVLISELDLQDCVSLEGPMTQHEVIEVYRGATVFVLPCLVTDSGDRDGIPNVLLEAMSMRIPVVSTEVSGIGELIEHTVNGLLVSERDAGAVASAIVLLLDQPQLRARMAERGRQKVLGAFEIVNSARAVLGAFEQLGAAAAWPETAEKNEVAF